MFICHRKDNTLTAYKYICGLIQAERSNMEQIEEKVDDADYGKLRHFISRSPWNSRNVMNRVAKQSYRLLWDAGFQALVIYEVSFSKKGNNSVGVMPQWNNELKKNNNCQIALFAVLSAGKYAIPVDVEFFIPANWTNDNKRCKNAGVPEERLKFKTKSELVMDIIKRQRSLGAKFEYVCIEKFGKSDFFSGKKNKVFYKELGNNSEFFFINVDKNRTVYIKEDGKVSWESPVPPNGKNHLIKSKQTRIKNILSHLKQDIINKTTIQNPFNNSLKISVFYLNVLVPSELKTGSREWTLFITQSNESPNINQCFLTNLPEEDAIVNLSLIFERRNLADSAFEDAKNKVGMSDYQVRKWLAWHHHISLCMMSILFLTENNILNIDNNLKPLSCVAIHFKLKGFLQSEKTNTANFICC